MAIVVSGSSGSLNRAELSQTPGGAVMTGSQALIFDGKELNAANTKRWSTAGTGTATYAANNSTLTVTTGQFLIKQSTTPMPYFSGYTAYTELTFDGFEPQTGVVKRAGYFSSAASPNLNTALDGFWLESSGGTYHIKVYNAGTEIASVPFSDWYGRAELGDVDFTNFSVIMFDFLWLGGAALRMWVAHPTRGFVLAHAIPYPASRKGTITKSPQQFVRYDISASGGGGAMRPICAQYSPLGGTDNKSTFRTQVATAAIACNSVGTTYALMGVKRNATYRDVPVKLASVGAVTGSVNDTGILMLLKNPTLSAAITYAPVGKVDFGFATTQTVTAIGTVINATPTTQTGETPDIDNYEAWFTQSAADVFDEYVLAFSPVTTNQSRYGILTWKEFG